MKSLILVLFFLIISTNFLIINAHSKDFDSNEEYANDEQYRSKHRKNVEANSYEQDELQHGFHRHRRYEYDPNQASGSMEYDAYDSAEIPIRPRRQYDYHPTQRPLYNLLLGILDTIHMSTKHDVLRAQERLRRSQGFVI